MSVLLRVHPPYPSPHRLPEPVQALHGLCESRLFTWERIRRLARDLPASSMQIHRGDVEMGADPVANQLPDCDPTEAIDALSERRVGVCFAGVDFDPEYRALLMDCLQEIGPEFELDERDFVEPRAYLLLSSPHAVHPFHLDSNYNLLLHVRGTKTIHIWHPEDRKVLAEEDLDYTFAVTQRLRFQANYLDRASVNHLSPGQAVFLRALSPHVVENGPHRSITLSVAFNTPGSLRRQVLHRINGNLRRWGWNPSPVGAHRNRDGLKYGAYRAARRVKHAIVR